MIEGGETPVVRSGEAGDATPLRPTNRLLDVDDSTRVSSRAASPARQLDDVEMEESAGEHAAAQTPVVVVQDVGEGITDKMDET